MAFDGDHNSVRVEVSPLNPKTEDADEWTVTPVLPDGIEVSDHLYIKNENHHFKLL